MNLSILKRLVFGEIAVLVKLMVLSSSEGAGGGLSSNGLRLIFHSAEDVEGGEASVVSVCFKWMFDLSCNDVESVVASHLSIIYNLYTVVCHHPNRR